LLTANSYSETGTSLCKLHHEYTTTWYYWLCKRVYKYVLL